MAVLADGWPRIRNGTEPAPRSLRPEPTPYAIDRYLNETTCLFGVLERRLRDQPFVAGGDYPVADTACYPWITLSEAAGQSLGEFPAPQRWFGQVQSRPATARAYATAETM